MQVKVLQVDGRKEDDLGILQAVDHIDLNSKLCLLSFFLFLLSFMFYQTH